MCSNGPFPEWWETDINVYIDGDEWCAVNGDFVDLQESDAGFGISPQDAVNALLTTITER